MSTNRSIAELLSDILNTPKYSDLTISSDEARAFQEIYGLYPIQVWENYGQGKGTHRSATIPVSIWVSSELPRCQFIQTEHKYHVLSITPPTLITMTIDNKKHVVDCSCPSGRLRLIPRDLINRWYEFDHDLKTFFVVHGNNAEHHWELKMTVLCTVIVPVSVGDPNKLSNVNPPSKEYSSMKPDFMKKSTTTRHAEHLNAETANVWCKFPPALIVGDNVVEVDVGERTDEEVNQLRREWFWAGRRRSVGYHRTKISFEMALERQDDLIDTASTFIGTKVYAATFDGVHYYYPVDRKDNVALLCLLDGSVWTDSKRAYPSALEDWDNNVSGEEVLLKGGLQEALLLQADIQRSRLKAQLKPAVTKPTTRRKPRAKAASKTAAK